MRPLFVIFLLTVLTFLPSSPAHALDKVDPYICPTMVNSSGMDCFLEAVPQTYTMCRQIKSIEVIEYGLTGAQEGVNGAKTEGCIEKHKLSITRPYQAALREAGRNKDEVIGLRKLYDTWLESMGKLIPGEKETDDGYKQRVSRPYSEFNDQIMALRTIAAAPKATVAKHHPPAVASKKNKPKT